jgi:hypothetical protein
MTRVLVKVILNISISMILFQKALTSSLSMLYCPGRIIEQSGG